MNQNKQYIPGEAENRRLELQNQLLDSFDYPVYAEVLTQTEPVTILDVGCNSGDMFIPKLKDFRINCYIGIDISEVQIEKAISRYGNERFHFCTMDIESAEFRQQLSNLMKSKGVHRFNVINISMVLLHLKNPQQVLHTLHDFLEEEGTIIVRDIDDGLNMAYPDECGWFRKIYRIADMDELTGNRTYGRMVFHDLVNAGYQKVELKRVGMSTVGFNEAQKREFFDMSFKAIMDRTEVMYQKYTDDPNYRENLEWKNAYQKKVHDLYMRKDFMTTLGFMTFTAKK